MSNVNGITNTLETFNVYSSVQNTPEKIEPTTENALANVNVENGAVYEKSEDVPKVTYSLNKEVVDKMKLENEARIQQLQDLVNKLLNGQGEAFCLATGTNIKDAFEKLEVDEETQKQAQEDISEDGYWGVKKTSQRIFDFAKALSGGDPEKMKEMREAFERGYEQAKDMWGDELPDICKQTYDATQKLFDDYGKDEDTES